MSAQLVNPGFHSAKENSQRPRGGFLFFHPPPRCRIKITAGTYMLSPENRISPWGTSWDSQILSKRGLLCLGVDAKLTLGYPEELVRREHTSSIKTLPLLLSLLRTVSHHWRLSPKATQKSLWKEILLLLIELLFHILEELLPAFLKIFLQAFCKNVHLNDICGDIFNARL